MAMLNCCSSSQCWSMIPSLMQAWIRYPIPSLFGSFAAYCHQSFFNVLRNIIIGFGSRHAALSIRFASWPKQSCAHYNKDLCLAMSLQFIIIICLGRVLMQMPEADAGAVHRAANQNRNPLGLMSFRRT